MSCEDSGSKSEGPDCLKEGYFHALEKQFFLKPPNCLELTSKHVLLWHPNSLFL